MPANGRWDLIRRLKVKKECIYTSTPLHAFVAQTGTTLLFGENNYKK